MQYRDRLGTKHYRLELSGEGHEPTPAIEFAADGLDAVLHAAERHASGRNVTVFEDGRPIARLRHAGKHGFWTVAPAPAAAG